MPKICWIVPLLFATTAAAQEPAREARERTISVTGTGVVQLEPDRAFLSLAVESFAAAAQEAAASNAQKMDALLAALRRLGLSGERVRTTSYNLFPQYDFRDAREPGQERLIGYRASNMVVVTIDELAKVGQVIDAAVAAGANRIHGVQFTLRDPDAARLRALPLAVTKARAEAEAIARAVGEPLGQVLSVSTAGGPPIPLIERAVTMEARPAGAPTPIEPGTLEVMAMVSMVFRIGSP